MANLTTLLLQTATMHNAMIAAIVLIGLFLPVIQNNALKNRAAAKPKIMATIFGVPILLAGIVVVSGDESLLYTGNVRKYEDWEEVEGEC